MTAVVRLLAGRRPRPARPRPRAAGPRAEAAPVLVELTAHYTVRAGRIYRDAIVRHADGTLCLHYIEEAAA